MLHCKKMGSFEAGLQARHVADGIETMPGFQRHSALRAVQDVVLVNGGLVNIHESWPDVPMDVICAKAYPEFLSSGMRGVSQK